MTAFPGFAFLARLQCCYFLQAVTCNACGIMMQLQQEKPTLGDCTVAAIHTRAQQQFDFSRHHICRQARALAASYSAAGLCR